MIIETIDLYAFRAAFKRAGRADNFSRDGLETLFDLLEEYSDDTGEPIELDVVALCCDWSEMSVDEVIEYYSIDVTDCEDDDARREYVIEYLDNNTIVRWIDDNRVIFQVF